MTSRWSKRRKLKSMIKSTESEILQQFNETSAQNSVSEENHVEAVKDYVEYPKVVIDSAGSDCNDSVTVPWWGV